MAKLWEPAYIDSTRKIGTLSSKEEYQKPYHNVTCSSQSSLASAYVMPSCFAYDREGNCHTVRQLDSVDFKAVFRRVILSRRLITSRKFPTRGSDLTCYLRPL